MGERAREEVEEERVSQIEEGKCGRESQRGDRRGESVWYEGPLRES